MKIRLEKQRDTSIDVLRWIAITCIIIAHCNPPVLLAQLRNFDVPLMVFLSAVCFKKNEQFLYWSYVKKRVWRIVIPVWLFLTFYHILIYITTSHISLKFILETYSFVTGWYPWIFRIFLTMALLAPFIYTFTKKVSNNIYIILFYLILFLNEFVANKCLSSAVGQMIIMTLPYALIFSLGIKINLLSNRALFFMASSFALFFIISGFTLFWEFEDFVPNFDYKYPPRLYYLTYALFFVLFFWNIRYRIVKIVDYIGINRFVLFVGSHTMWIYLWHIIIVVALKNYHFIYLFPLAYLVPVFITFLQCRFLNQVCNRIECVNTVKKLKIIFEG